MSESAQNVLQAALSLSHDEQLVVLNGLYEAAEQRGEILPFDNQWMELARERTNEILSGTVKPLSWEEERARIHGPKNNRD